MTVAVGQRRRGAVARSAWRTAASRCFPPTPSTASCCDPDDEQAARRLYQLKGRPSARPAAVMFFALEPALAALPELLDSERAASARAAARPADAAAGQPRPALRGRLPHRPRDARPARAAAARARCARWPSIATPVMQTSANVSGEPDARSLADVPRDLRDGADAGARRRRAAGHALDGRRPARLRRRGQLARAARGRARGAAPSARRSPARAEGRVRGGRSRPAILAPC